MDTVLVFASKTEDYGSFGFDSCRKELIDEFQNTCLSEGLEFTIRENSLFLTLTDTFTLFRLAARRRSASEWNYEFSFSDKNSEFIIRNFVTQYREARQISTSVKNEISPEEINSKLSAAQFNKRILTKEQMRDLIHLLSLPHGANFSVPGAGKTTVTLALNTLLEDRIEKTLVICPKSAFEAWESVVKECIENPKETELFQRVFGDARTIRMILDNPKYNRFYINYELATSSDENFKELKRFLGMHRVHLIIDESHRIKAGPGSLRGRLALSLANLAVRKDILSGTPMPQGASDISAQAEFLYPGFGFASQIKNKVPPGVVMSGLFVRTKKKELGLKDYKRFEERIDMLPAQAAIYAILCNQTIAQFHSDQLTRSQVKYLTRGNAMRLLQASVFPRLLESGKEVFPEILDAAFEEGPGKKMLRAIEICESNAKKGLKTVVWTVFTGTLLELQRQMKHLEAQVLFGGNPNVDSPDLNSRETSLRKFASDRDCFVLIANPAAASEGLSLHKHCHDAVYVDRTYNAAHYLQSIDRIHRLGLSNDVETNVTILKSNIPKGISPTAIGGIDDSVMRRLRAKVDNLHQLLDDEDLREIAFAEDDALPSDVSEMDQDDIIDLIQELTGKKVSK
jgi:SNF2 family DNA or RNA helicase